MNFQESVHLRSVYNIEALVWSLVLGVYLLRFMTLGTKINRKYRNLSVLITEQVSFSDHRFIHNIKYGQMNSTLWSKGASEGLDLSSRFNEVVLTCFAPFVA